jgi:NAD(P)-dependent dehydrogenase (short-subunit alcohol dehydrogenase family)
VLAVELAPAGVRVNTVRSGPTDTDMFRGLLGGADDAAVGAVGAPFPLGRIARAEEVAAAALFLMANQYVTGTVITVDGGASHA